ncbi:hypothetical protein MMC17_002757 [Xylographa soralifera]|nr:hypothetical protein [Xylographa soralifera]
MPKSQAKRSRDIPKETVDFLEGFSWEDLELEKEYLAETNTPFVHGDSADHEILGRPHDDLPNDNNRTEDDASQGVDTVILGIKEESAAEEEGIDSPGDRSTILGNEDDTPANQEVNADHEEPALGACSSQLRAKNGGREFERYFEGIFFPRDFVMNTLINLKPEIELQTEAVANSKEPLQEGCNDFEIGMTDEEFAHFAEQVALQIGAACDTETTPSDRRVSQAETSTSGQTVPTSIARMLPDGVAETDGAIQAKATPLAASGSSFGDFGMTDEEILEVTAHGRVTKEAMGETKLSTFEREVAQVAATYPRQTVSQAGAAAQAELAAPPQVQMTTRTDKAAPLLPGARPPTVSPGQWSPTPDMHIPQAKTQTPVSEAQVLNTLELFLHNQGISSEDLFLSAEEVATIRDLPSIPIEPAIDTSATGKPQTVKDPQPNPEAGPATSPIHTIAGDIVAPSQASSHTLVFTPCEVANLERRTTPEAQRSLVNSPLAIPQPGPLLYLPSAHAALIAPANCGADTPAKAKVVGTVLIGAHKAAFEAAHLAPSVTARLRQNGDCVEEWVASYNRK